MNALGRYELVKLIGQGGMSTVYLAKDSVIGRKLAVKVLNPGFLSNPGFARYFVQEAQLIGHLKHPGIAEIYDVGQQDDKAFIVMEFVEGKSLEHLRGSLDLKSLRKILVQVADALDYIHAHGVVHRDVKPGNIIVKDDLTVKLLDFGLARVLEKRPRDTSGFRTVGTVLYMSPEQIKSPRQTGPASDEFALGVVAYELLTGELPFSGGSAEESDFRVMERIVGEELVPASHYNSSLSVEVDAVFSRALSKKPEDRFVRCREFIETLFNAVDKGGKREKNKKVASKGQSGRGRRKESGASTGKGPPIPPKVGRGVGEGPSDEQPDNWRSISRLAIGKAPSGFFRSEIFPRTRYFADDDVRFAKIEESLNFYRELILREYTALAKQADTTYKLWIFCVGLGFIILITGVVIMFFVGLTKGALTLGSTVLVYFVQHMFRQREDHYRKLAAEKNAHLEYGNQWLLVIQSIDAIEDPDERLRRQTRLVDVLTEKLNGRVVGAC